MELQIQWMDWSEEDYFVWPDNYLSNVEKKIDKSDSSSESDNSDSSCESEIKKWNNFKIFNFILLKY